MAETTKYIAEFLGTFLLVFTVGCNVLSKNAAWAGVSIACVLMVAIYSLGGISGANFNPAVSVTLAITNSMKGPGKMDWKTCGIYCGSQILGGIVGAMSYALLFWTSFDLGPAKGFGGLSAGLCETFYTFMLCFVVLNVAVRYSPPDSGASQFFGLAIGFVIVAGAYGAGAVSGGCFNPAVAIGIDVSGAGARMGWCLAYTVFELLGAALAALAFKVVRPGEFDPMCQEGLTSQLTSEFLGTFMLVLTVGLNVLGNSPAGAFSIAASLMCMIYALGDVSGAHFNPAVTLAVLGSGQVPDMTPKKAGLYMGVQILGAIAASSMYTLIYSGKTFALGPKPGHFWAQVAVAEIIFTFVLCFVVLSTAVYSATKSENMFGLAIGSCVTVGGLAIGSISGGSLNPAVSVGIASSQILNGGFFYKALIYSAFEFIGAAAAVGITKITHADYGKKDDATEKFRG